jgi:nicotinamidase-related amidase
MESKGKMPGMTIVDEWADVKIPPPPELKPVTVEPNATALLILGIQIQMCTLEKRPRCVNSVPNILNLLTKAREKGMLVVYSLAGNAAASDILKEVALVSGDPVVKSGADKFFNTELDKILKERGINTVIVTDTSAHGAVLHTATDAALRGMQVIVPVDGMSADDTYPEQYTSWHLANGPRSRQRTALTRASLIHF